LGLNLDKRKRIALYFLKFPQWTLASLAVGIVILVAAESPLGYLFGLAAVGVSGATAWFSLAARPKDAEMDTWLDEDLEKLKPRALAKGGLDETELVGETVMLVGPRFRNLGGAFFGFRRGADRRARFTPVHVTIINFTEHQLVVYQCAFDLFTGNPLNECVDEYFYTDVVAVTILSEAMTYSVGELDRRILSRIPKLGESAVNGLVQVNNAETFVLTTAGGSTTRVVLRDPVLIEGLGGGEVPTERADKAVGAVRTMLRIKKAGALPLRTAS
jgi:hypothetical protein